MRQAKRYQISECYDKHATRLKNDHEGKSETEIRDALVMKNNSERAAIPVDWLTTKGK